MDRNEILDRVRKRKEPWDIIVIGGGATGVGCALDAASRGYEVLLLEQHDFGKGTSSRSTKLVHGGVRYLRQGNISLVREALRERGILLRTAPHVVHSQQFIVSCYGLWQKIFYGVGLKVYDLLAGKDRFGKSQILSKKRTVDMLPTVNDKGLSGGVLYTDGQFDDARLLIDMAMTASKHGAALLNYAGVRSLIKDENGNVCGASFENSGETITVRARSIINATGAFCDAVRSMSDKKAKPVVTFSQGIHLVFDRRFLPADHALMIPKTSDGRVLFCIPWQGHTLVGTTDTPVNSAELEPTALESEIDFVLETVGKYLTESPKRSDIMSVFAGVRPLVKGRHSTKTSAISRGHDLFVDDAGLVTITGGKWTTYRRMAEDAVNKASEITGLAPHECITATLAISASVIESGSKLLHPDLSYTQNDVMRAVREEMAMTVEDVLARRTRALFLNAKASIQIAPRVAEIMATETGKDKAWIENQIAAFESVAAGYVARPI